MDEGSEEQTIQVIDEPATSEETGIPEMILEKQPAEDTAVLQTPTSTTETVLVDVDVVQPSMTQVIDDKINY